MNVFQALSTVLLGLFVQQANSQQLPSAVANGHPGVLTSNPVPYQRFLYQVAPIATGGYGLHAGLPIYYGLPSGQHGVPATYDSGPVPYGYGWTQDRTVLNNAYKHMRKVNSGLRKSSRLEKLAQSTQRCEVYSHDHHKDTDAYGGWNHSVLSCAGPGGCKESLSNWSRSDPLRIFREHKHQTGHWDAITNRNYKRVGCAANKCSSSSESIYFWCYLAA